MPNVKQIIDGHNKSKLPKSSTTDNETVCNCQKKNECPLSNKCTTQSVVYQATVTTISKTFHKPPQTYIRLTENSFKTRYANHKASFNSYNKRNSTELSKFVWELKSRQDRTTRLNGKYLGVLDLTTQLQMGVICAYGRSTILLYVNHGWLL